MLNLILFGPPGSGKGTQAAVLAKKYKLKHISTGDILRNEVSNKTPLGKEAKKFMNKGELVPDKVIIGMVENAFEEYKKDYKGFIFDGFPRTVKQAKALDKMLHKKAERIARVMSLQVPEEELVERLLLRAKESNRPDDTEDVIRNRMVVYHDSTAPVAKYYTKKAKLSNIEGVGSIKSISKTLNSKVDLVVPIVKLWKDMDTKKKKKK